MQGTTLLWGTANPVGMRDYSGVYLNTDDIRDMITQVEDSNRKGDPMPVHVDHKGVCVGRVITAWEHQGSLECVLALNNGVLEGSIGSEFVRSGICRDLSMGYTLSMQQSDNGGIQVGKKRLKEISIVKRGARPKCHIHGVAAASPFAPASSAGAIRKKNAT
jgi:hypothetical protein